MRLAPKQESKQESWILGATIVTQNSDRDVFRKNIRIQGNTIVEITSKTPKNSKTKKIQAQGLVVFPGFVQTHVHLCQTLFRNWADDLELLDWLQKKIWPYESLHTEETLFTSATIGIRELLSTGTTTVLDMGTVRHTNVIFEAVQKWGIRASVGKCLMDHPEQTPAYLRENKDAALKEALDLFHQWNGSSHDRIRVSLAPRFAISCTDELLREVAQVAQKKRILIHTHASENRGEIELVRRRSGFENIEFLANLGFLDCHTVLAHGVWIKDFEMKLLKQAKQVSIAHCPSSNLKLASGIAPIPALRKYGICVSLGADGAPCNNQLSMLEEMRMAALIQKPQHGPKSIRAVEALDMATREGAKALGWEDQIGSIEVGKKADLICFDLNRPENFLSSSVSKQSPEFFASALVYSSSAQHLRWTMVDGKVLFEDGCVSGISDQKLLKDIEKSQSKILRSGMTKRLF